MRNTAYNRINGACRKLCMVGNDATVYSDMWVL